MKIRFLCLRPAALPLALSCVLPAAFAQVAEPVSAASAPVRAASGAAPATALPEMVVTANRIEQPLTDVLADVTVIDRPQIEQSGAVNLSDLLARQPQLTLSRTGGPGTASSLFLRGADNRFTAVYIDGVRIDTQSTGGAPWESVALGQIDRIEIVRGPAAAVYGSDAVAGVVQIFTRKGEGEGAFVPYVGVGLGSQARKRAEAGFSGQSGAVDYALGVERDISHGYNAMPDGNPDRDGYRQSAASGRLGVKLGEAHRLELTGTYNRMDAQYDGFMSSADDHGLNRLRTLGASWTAQWTPAYRTQLSVSESQAGYDSEPMPFSTRTRLRNYLLQNEWRQGAHLLTATLERREDQLRNDPIDQGRHQNAIALGYGYSSDAHTLQLNLRHDRDSEFGGQTTGGVAYGWRFAPGWRVTAGAGTAFRVPTLYQRFSEYGAANLAPEKGRNLELGLHWAQDGSRAGLTVYRTRLSNLINFGAPGACASPYGCYENVGRAVLQGLSLSGGTRLGGFNLGASLDLQNPHNADTDQLLARRARRVLKLNADTRVATGALDWTLGAEWQASSMRWDNAANTQRLGGYGLLNLYASTVVARDWTLLARIDNVTDKSYQLAQGYATPGRTLFVGLRWAPR